MKPNAELLWVPVSWMRLYTADACSGCTIKIVPLGPVDGTISRLRERMAYLSGIFRVWIVQCAQSNKFVCPHWADLTSGGLKVSSLPRPQVYLPSVNEINKITHLRTSKGHLPTGRELGTQFTSSVPSEHSAVPLHLQESGIHRVTSHMNSFLSHPGKISRQKGGKCELDTGLIRRPFLTNPTTEQSK